MKLCGIYKITNINNNKIYLGKSIDIERRIKHHKKQLLYNKHYNYHLQQAYNLYTVKSFKFDIILLCDVSLLGQYEQDLIFLSESYKPEIGYNMTMGGDGGEIPTEEVRKKISIFHTGRKASAETRLKQSLAKQNMSQETKTKMSNSAKEKIFSAEHRNNLSKALLGNTRLVGNTIWVGRKHTNETKEKMKASSAKRTDRGSKKDIK